ncbi:hypothetical protein Ddye_016304 [Dipteronia dyeriana]|uniref:Aminotransferase class I/classII large domain-containing protein n=1 Tax=Dipteronia dyeriana TaxID=168575 RepID=A0AAD9U6I2_9ROSI|nr:hypothetical protein Ddye_016304 [Dipteronia dyeriana]
MELSPPTGELTNKTIGKTELMNCPHKKATVAMELKRNLGIFMDLGVEENDIFVSDGAKCNISQVVFGSNVTSAVQHPSHPAYVDSTIIMGQTGQFQKDVEKYRNIEYMMCSLENDFFPDLLTVARTYIIFFCSPNTPTGAATTREQLTRLVQFAKDNGSIISSFMILYMLCICLMIIYDQSLKFLEPKR